MQLLARNFATYIKKPCIHKTDKKAGKAPKTNVTQEKRVLIKHVEKKR